VGADKKLKSNLKLVESKNYCYALRNWILLDKKFKVVEKTVEPETGNQNFKQKKWLNL
jgi:hypothetical protein